MTVNVCHARLDARMHGNMARRRIVPGGGDGGVGRDQEALAANQTGRYIVMARTVMVYIVMVETRRRWLRSNWDGYNCGPLWPI